MSYYTITSIAWDFTTDDIRCIVCDPYTDNHSIVLKSGREVRLYPALGLYQLAVRDFPEHFITVDTNTYVPPF